VDAAWAPSAGARYLAVRQTVNDFAFSGVRMTRVLDAEVRDYP